MPIFRFYIDGFNLYYGSLRRNRLHWLDLNNFCELSAGGPVDKILYCTAMVKPPPNDPLKAIRQQAYIRALGAYSNVEIVKGQYKRQRAVHELWACEDKNPCLVRTWKVEEKGSDVNLASRLIHDAHMKRFDRAFVVSGDSDLVEPIRLVVREIGLPVEVHNPDGNPRSKELSRVATAYKRVDIAHLQKSQLPDPVNRAGKGPVHKPPKWSAQHGESFNDMTHGNCQQCGACIESRQFL